MEFLDDRTIINKVLEGDIAAYAYLVNKHKDMAFTIAVKITHNREEAEEVAQDAFVKAYQSLGSFRQQSRFSTWLYRIVYNTAISMMRKKQVEMTAIDDEIIENFSIDEVHEDLNSMSPDEQRMLIDASLEKLSAEDNLVITLFYMDDHTIDEISQITGQSKANVKVKLHRIRKKLYSELNQSIRRILNETVK
jgi:RNA polymerase sigma-70 factor (ECF subfamily)